MKLYELATAYRQLTDLEDEDFALALSQLQGAIEEKGANIMALTQELEGEAEVYTAEAKRLQERATAAKNRLAFLKAYLFEQMQVAGMDKLKTRLFTATIQNSPPSGTVLDKEAIPAQYIEVITEYRVRMREIIGRWKETGEAMPGVEVKQGKHLVIR